MITRIQYIDIAKGISISLVAMQHANLKFYFPEIIEQMGLFRMPLFFLLSGIFFSWSAKPKYFLLKKSEALLKPYFSVLLVVFFIGLLSGEDALFWRLKGIFYGNAETISWVAIWWAPLWFLTHLFAVYLYVYLLFRYTAFPDLSQIINYIILLLFLLVGSVYMGSFWQKDIEVFSSSITLPGLPFSLDIILLTSFYFILGALFKHKLAQFKPEVWIFILSLLIFFCVSQFTNAHIDFNQRIYNFPIYATLAAASGIYIVLSISYFISKSHWLSLIPNLLGQASLYILIFHNFIGGNIYYLFAHDLSNERSLMLLSVVSFGASIFLPLSIKWIVEKNDLLSLAFLPFRSTNCYRGRSISADEQSVRNKRG